MTDIPFTDSVYDRGAIIFWFPSSLSLTFEHPHFFTTVGRVDKQSSCSSFLRVTLAGR